mmetsp:Transcript_47478/g.55458  ORF Transcript_47478/g.55458 Transcript_47478/m.55458 type:complete len:565 (-) Transcript_47478:181-1875(-)
MPTRIPSSSNHFNILRLDKDRHEADAITYCHRRNNLGVNHHSIQHNLLAPIKLVNKNSLIPFKKDEPNIYHGKDYTCNTNASSYHTPPFQHNVLKYGHNDYSGEVQHLHSHGNFHTNQASYNNDSRDDIVTRQDSKRPNTVHHMTNVLSCKNEMETPNSRYLGPSSCFSGTHLRGAGLKSPNYDHSNNCNVLSHDMLERGFNSCSNEAPYSHCRDEYHAAQASYTNNNLDDIIARQGRERFASRHHMANNFLSVNKTEAQDSRYCGSCSHFTGNNSWEVGLDNFSYDQAKNCQRLSHEIDKPEQDLAPVKARFYLKNSTTNQDNYESFQRQCSFFDRNHDLQNSSELSCSENPCHSASVLKERDATMFHESNVKLDFTINLKCSFSNDFHQSRRRLSLKSNNAQTNFTANSSQFDDMVDGKAKTGEFVATQTSESLTARVASTLTFTNENLYQDLTKVKVTHDCLKKNPTDIQNDAYDLESLQHKVKPPVRFDPPNNGRVPLQGKRRKRRKCSVVVCQNRVVQGGVCISHGAKRRKCSVLGCKKNVKSGGKCSKHRVHMECIVK